MHLPRTVWLQLTRFPQVFSYSVKAHLRPQLAYLESLGVPHDELRDYVVARPLLLGEVRLFPRCDVVLRVCCARERSRLSF